MLSAVAFSTEAVRAERYVWEDEATRPYFPKEARSKLRPNVHSLFAKPNGGVGTGKSKCKSLMERESIICLY